MILTDAHDWSIFRQNSWKIISKVWQPPIGLFGQLIGSTKFFFNNNAIIVNHNTTVLLIACNTKGNHFENSHSKLHSVILYKFKSNIEKNRVIYKLISYSSFDLFRYFLPNQMYPKKIVLQCK